MAKYLLWLSLSLLGTSNAYAYCYYTQTSGGLPVFSSIGSASGLTLQYCQSLACQIWPNIVGCPGTTAPPQTVTCTYSAQTQTRTCPANYSGIQTWKKETNCPTGSYGQPVTTDWFKIQDTCTPNPPTCQTSSQTQTLTCQSGYTGSITQTRVSTCPDPYGSPVWQNWTTTSDTCVKSITNVTNPVSPLSPVNTATTSATTPVATPATVSTTNTSVPTTPTELATVMPSVQTKTETTKTDSQTTSSTQTSTTGVKLNSAVGITLSLELFVKPGIQQPSIFPMLSLNQPMPIEMVMQDSVMGLMFQPTIKQYLEPQELGFEQ